MQDKAIPSPSIAEEDRAAEQAVMRLLLEERGPFQVGEVATAVSGAIAAEDAIARLKRGGLIHECDGFIFASRAAVVSADLWGND
jgi:hypothetical protein